ncbi:MAG: helix-turn-helix transcriptional regulator [Phycisphaerales bacterium]
MAPADTSSEAVGHRLRLAREQAGLSQGQVARILKLHRPTISQIEGGQRVVKPVEVAQLAELYKVKQGWIVSGESVGAAGGDPRVELAARELSKLKKQDLDKIMQLLSVLRSSTEAEQ